MSMRKKSSTRSTQSLRSERAGRRGPLVERHLPEIRSDIKWRFATGSSTTINPSAEIVICWTFGVPFNEMLRFHNWLAANEQLIVQRLAFLRNGVNATNVSYGGTYLNIDCGAPMYRTYWQFENENAAEAGLDPLLVDSTLKDFVLEIRRRWGADPGRTEHRFGMAARYTQFTNLLNSLNQPQLLVEIQPQI